MQVDHVVKPPYFDFQFHCSVMSLSLVHISTRGSSSTRSVSHLQQSCKPHISGLKEFQTQLSFRKNVHPTEVADHFEAGRQLQFALQLSDQFVQEGLGGSANFSYHWRNHGNVVVLALQALHIVHQLEGFVTVRVPYAGVHQLRNLEDFKHLKHKCTNQELHTIHSEHRKA